MFWWVSGEMTEHAHERAWMTQSDQIPAKQKQRRHWSVVNTHTHTHTLGTQQQKKQLLSKQLEETPQELQGTLRNNFVLWKSKHSWQFRAKCG